MNTLCYFFIRLKTKKLLFPHFPNVEIITILIKVRRFEGENADMGR